MNRKTVITACILIALSIILGAIAAHALENQLTDKLLKNWETAARYQMYGGLGLLAVGLAADKFKSDIKIFSILLTLGILLFSGCLYLYCFESSVPSFGKLVIVVPIGGFLMIIAWVILLIQLIRSGR